MVQLLPELWGKNGVIAMNKQESLCILDKCIGDSPSITEVIAALTCGFLDTHDIEPYMNTIIESLTKQTPQKVTHEATLIRDTTCPRCKNVVGSYIDFNGVKTKVQYQYCSICGQALDWSDENEV